MAKSKDGNSGNPAAMEGQDHPELVDQHGDPMRMVPRYDQKMPDNMMDHPGDAVHVRDNPVHDHAQHGDHGHDDKSQDAPKDDQPKDHSLPHAVQANVTPEPVPVATPVVDEHAVSHPAPQMAAGSRYVLPKWQSHSEVYAAPIQGFDEHHIHVDGGDNPNVMQLVMVRRPAGIFDRGEPAFGDYLIMYPAGGMSWMPKKAFEASHTRMPDDAV